MIKRPLNAESAVKRLNEALAAEIIRALRHKSRGHADVIAERIVQLGGVPDYSAVKLAFRRRWKREARA